MTALRRRRFLRAMGLTGGSAVLAHWTDNLIARAFGQTSGRQIAVVIAVGEAFQGDRMYPKEFQKQGDKKTLQTLSAVAPTTNFTWPNYLSALQGLRGDSVMVDGPHMGLDGNGWEAKPHGQQTGVLSGIRPRGGTGGGSGFIGTPEVATIDGVLAPVLSQGLPVQKLVAGLSGVSFDKKLSEQATMFASRAKKLDAHKTSASGLHHAAFAGGLDAGAGGGTVFAPRFADLIANDASRIMRGLASEEKAVLESYIDAVDVHEKSLKDRAVAVADCNVPGQPTGATPENEVRGMFDTAKVALACGLTNVFGLAIGYEPGHASIPNFPDVFKGITSGGYDAHGGYVPRTSEALNAFVATQINGLVQTLKGSGDIDGKSLYDKTVITWLSETGGTIGGHHAAPGNPFPTVLLGGHPKLRSGGRFIRYRTRDHYLSEVHSSVATMFGIDATEIQRHPNSSYKGDLNDILA